MRWWQSLLAQLALTGIQILNIKFTPKTEYAISVAAATGAAQGGVHKSATGRDEEGNKL